MNTKRLTLVLTILCYFIILSITAQTGCPTTLAIPNPNSTTYNASQIINSDGVISMSNTTTYMAGDCITLEAGFEVELDAEFCAIIQSCTPNACAYPTPFDFEIEGTNSSFVNDLSGMTTNHHDPNEVFCMHQEGQIYVWDFHEASIDSMQTPVLYGNPKVSPIITGDGNDDFEGLTYLFQDYYGAVDEKDGKIYLFSISMNIVGMDTTYIVDQNINAGASIEQTFVDNLGQPIVTVGENDGTEGITYDPMSEKIYVVKESPALLYRSVNTYSTLADFNTPIEVELISVSGITGGDDFAGIYHYNITTDCIDNQDLLYIVSETANTVYELQISGTTATLINSFVLPLPNSLIKYEGIVVNRNRIALTNDRAIDKAVYTFERNTNRGDANCDGEVTIEDAELIGEYTVGAVSNWSYDCSSDINLSNADMDCDGDVDIVDALFVSQCVEAITNPSCPCGY